MTSIVGLANTNAGQAIMQPLLDNGEILRLSNEVIQTFYRARSEQARALVEEYFDPSLPWRVHKREGALFLWLWFEDLPISAGELYERLKARDVLVVSGNYFFYGLEDESWAHRNECLRISFTMPEETVREGFRIIGEEVRNAYAGG